MMGGVRRLVGQTTSSSFPLRPFRASRRAVATPASPILSGTGLRAHVERSELWRPRREVLVAKDFQTLFHETIPEVRVTYEQWGDPSLPGDRTVVVFPSFSHGHHMASNLADPSPGWWDSMVGPDKPIDTNHFRVVCPSILGSPFGSTCPTSVHPITGRQYRASFPQISPADQARVHALLLSQLGLETVHAVVGASLGGMQTLQFAAQFPERVRRIAVLVSTPKTTPGSVALRRVQRQAIMMDPAWRLGDYADAPGEASKGPVHGLRVARELGMFTYRSREELDARFDWRVNGNPSVFAAAHHAKKVHSPSHKAAAAAPHGVGSLPDHGPGSLADSMAATPPPFEVEAYLQYQGAKFASRFDANAYLLLSRCMDLMDLATPWAHPGRTLAEAVARIRADVLLIGVKQDLLTPSNELRTLARMLRRARAQAAGVADPDAEALRCESEAVEAAATLHAGLASSSAHEESVLREHLRRYNVQFAELDTPFGHDAFLKEFDLFGPLVLGHLERGLEDALAGERVHNMGLHHP